MFLFVMFMILCFTCVLLHSSGLSNLVLNFIYKIYVIFGKRVFGYAGPGVPWSEAGEPLPKFSFCHVVFVLWQVANGTILF